MELHDMMMKRSKKMKRPMKSVSNWLIIWIHFLQDEEFVHLKSQNTVNSFFPVMGKMRVWVNKIKFDVNLSCIK